MVFRYIHEKVNQNGSRERLVTEFEQSEIVFGRGGDSHILLMSQRGSVHHARFEWLGSELIVSDLNSLTGVRVNTKRVSRAQVVSGDVVSIAELEIKVRIETGIVELLATSNAVAAESDAQRLSGWASALQIEHYLPSMRVLVVGIVVVGFIGCLMYPLGARNYDSWNSGPISNAHKLIEGDCQKCHSEPFRPVQDRECLTCHALSQHSKNIDMFTKQHPNLEFRCAQCHMEHNGDHGLIQKDAAFCVGCHGSMSKLSKDAAILDVPSFASHPEFRVSVTDASGHVARVDITDAAKAIDSTPIKLNHEVHLKAGLRGKDGPVTLECSSCHHLSENYRNFEPITFDKDCRDCHALGFDERLPDVQVPHGDAEAVYPALFTEYTKLHLLQGAKGSGSSGEEPARMLPGEQGNVQRKHEPVDVGIVARDARDAEKQLFTKTGCFLCHSFSERSAQERTDSNSHYTITKPEIPNVWLPGARFSHGAHEEFSCESCHEKTRMSQKTTDLLLPAKKLCQQCHSDENKEGYVSSGCAECHSYHDALGIPSKKKQSIADYLHSLTR
jgi:pSer/pThr/pTyr-binding forkhead associated (FHA) protein